MKNKAVAITSIVVDGNRTAVTAAKSQVRHNVKALTEGGYVLTSLTSTCPVPTMGVVTVVLSLDYTSVSAATWAFEEYTMREVSFVLGEGIENARRVTTRIEWAE